MSSKIKSLNHASNIIIQYRNLQYFISNYLSNFLFVEFWVIPVLVPVVSLGTYYVIVWQKNKIIVIWLFSDQHRWRRYALKTTLFS